MSKSQVRVAATIILGSFVILSGSRSFGELAPPDCFTDETHYAESPCFHGNCDSLPSVRNSYIPDSTSSEVYVRLFFNVLREDDGSNPSLSIENMLGQIEQLNQAFSAGRMEFVYDWQFIDSSYYRYWGINDSGKFLDSMRLRFVQDPDLQLNVWIPCFVDCSASGGLAVLPFKGRNPLGPHGGVLVNEGSMYPNWNHILSHEIGHCLGLWHVHHGAGEGPADVRPKSWTLLTPGLCG